MKLQPFTMAFVVSAGLLAGVLGACSSSDSGAGGASSTSSTAATTTTVATTSTTDTSTSTSSAGGAGGAGGGGSGGAATTSSGDGGGGGAGGGATTSTGGGPECFPNCLADYPDGAPDFQALLSCINCDECYVLCHGVNKNCPADPPPTACDQTSANCAACIVCATDPGSEGGGGNPPGGCFAYRLACDNNPACLALQACSELCP